MFPTCDRGGRLHAFSRGPLPRVSTFLSNYRGREARSDPPLYRAGGRIVAAMSPPGWLDLGELPQVDSQLDIQSRKKVDTPAKLNCASISGHLRGALGPRTGNGRAFYTDRPMACFDHGGRSLGARCNRARRLTRAPGLAPHMRPHWGDHGSIEANDHARIARGYFDL